MRCAELLVQYTDIAQVRRNEVRRVAGAVRQHFTGA